VIARIDRAPITDRRSLWVVYGRVMLMMTISFQWQTPRLCIRRAPTGGWMVVGASRPHSRCTDRQARCRPSARTAPLA